MAYLKEVLLSEERMLKFRSYQGICIGIDTLIIIKPTKYYSIKSNKKITDTLYYQVLKVSIDNKRYQIIDSVQINPPYSYFEVGDSVFWGKAFRALPSRL